MRMIAAAALLVGTAANAAPPTKLYVFGDSLVDAGNVWVGSGFTVPPASAGYFQGRFTNGPAWTDLLERRVTGGYTKPYLLGGTNYAVGGARAASDALTPTPGGDTAVLPGLASQALWFGGQTGGAVDPKALYVISFGNNDATALRTGDTYVIQGGVRVPVTAAQYTQAFVTNIVQSAGYALARGGTVFVGGVPKPDDPTSLALQSALDAGLNPLSAAYGERLIRYSYADAFAAMRADPTGFGLAADTNFGTGPLDNCLAARAVMGRMSCGKFFSFDGTHPTKQVHQALLREVAPLLGMSAVPEPGAWATMILGFGLVGLTLRRRAVVVA